MVPSSWAMPRTSNLVGMGTVDLGTTERYQLTTPQRSEWIERTPGMADAGAGWLAGLDGRLAAAAVVRLGRLIADTAPRLAPALLSRDGDAIIDALAQLAIRGGPTYVK